MFDRQTLRGKSLGLDVAAAIVTALIVLLAAWYVFEDFKERFLQVNLADASNVSVVIDSGLASSQEKLVLYGMLSEQDRHRIAPTRYDSYSDLYALDQQGQITVIYKASPNSQLFKGYRFTAGPVWEQLLQSNQTSAISAIVQGYEDGLPSVYMIHRTQGETILGRLNLEYIRDFLRQYSQITGNILLITTNTGVVMISGQSDLELPRVQITPQDGLKQQLPRIEVLDQGWIPVVNDSPVLRARLVVLVSTKLLDDQRQAFLIALAAVMAGLILVIWLKNKKLNRDVLQPIAALMRRIRAMETGQQLITKSSDLTKPPVEFMEIDLRFESMAQAIRQREIALESAADEIRQRERDLRLILQYVPVPLIVFKTAPPTELVFINDSFTSVFGYTSDRIKTIDQLFEYSCQTTETAAKVSEQVVSLARAHADSGSPNDPIEVKIACQSGVLHDVIIAAIALDTTAVATFIDVTALRKTQRELLKAKDQAEEQEQQKTQFLAMMSHEIRTPLTSILGITEILSNEQLSEKQQDLVVRLVDVGNLLMRIVNDVLDHSKIEAGELSLDSRSFNPRELMRKCERMFSNMARNNCLNLIIQIDPECPDWLVGDAYRIEQVLSNLIGNAIKFTDFGEITVTLNGSQEQDSLYKLRVEVTDTGIGVSEELQPLLFSPFKQIDTPTRSGSSGTGLGLSISKRLVNLMGGSIGFKSKANKGSSFWFELTLPLGQDGSGALQPQVSAANPEKKRALSGLHVLVVDDSQAIQFLIQEILSHVGITVTLAIDGIQAIERLHQSNQSFDAILMDIQMPNMDGIQCTRAIRNDPAFNRVPIIAMTAGIIDTRMGDIIAAGASVVLHKPIQAETLIECLASHLEFSDDGFPKIEGIDSVHAMKTMNHNPDLFKRLLRLFITENGAIAQATLTALKQGGHEQAARHMHSLRGGAGQIGALEIRDLALAIENWILERKPLPTQLIGELQDSLDRLKKSADANL
jgi:signal transduction histidine kinase/DNA-binding NarL/FixJ family response regulator